MNAHLVVFLLAIFLIGIGISGQVGFVISTIALIGLIICLVIAWAS